MSFSLFWKNVHTRVYPKVSGLSSCSSLPVRKLLDTPSKRTLQMSPQWCRWYCWKDLSHIDRLNTITSDNNLWLLFVRSVIKINRNLQRLFTQGNRQQDHDCVQLWRSFDILYRCKNFKTINSPICRNITTYGLIHIVIQLLSQIHLKWIRHCPIWRNIFSYLLFKVFLTFYA
jgi:hypothetical protein